VLYAIVAAISVFAGWKLRGMIELALTRAIVRLLVSDFGKPKALELLQRAIEKATIK